MGRGQRPANPDTEPAAVEQHLGDRLAALVDGELGHDARERVLAHLATCWSCKAEADAQRRLKNVFADTAPPPPSDTLMARLQGLPAAPVPPEGGPGRRGGETPPGAGGRRSPWDFDHLSPRRSGGKSSPLSPERGFRIHEAERAASRGRRFAFAAAGAFSLAALAMGGALNSAASGGSSSGGGASASPVRSASAGGAGLTARDSVRRAPASETSRHDLGAMSAPGSVALPDAPVRAGQLSVPARDGGSSPADATPVPTALTGPAPRTSPLLVDRFQLTGPAPRWGPGLETPRAPYTPLLVNAPVLPTGARIPVEPPAEQAPPPAEEAVPGVSGPTPMATSVSWAPEPNPVAPGGGARK
ncbi:hypothetical protein E0L36_11145 [Streptomyces sp. AJS327]|nr:zf-HC2 domain-containing protein [Streptomyces sp. AJS327]MBA0051426.1 hypothetical protein [Streptomyces sp. AJS327]